MEVPWDGKVKVGGSVADGFVMLSPRNTAMESKMMPNLQPVFKKKKKKAQNFGSNHKGHSTKAYF